ncbi:Rieske 2Fe-2S domain-containing protein [Frankia sp. Cas4]|uniref:Rieske 2Fe-2S domain-containing protein n=1 Tax=Frankia sp. Cas4 TaxID=3073927 RepID=UPI002AD3899A|nr:Rieske 2Fe-2S domain-containing protein [Frankia sp. Cas4]
MSAPRRRRKAYDRRLLANQPAHEEQLTDYPVGWYFARFGEDLKAGQVVPVEFMSRQFALFRNRTGTVGMIDSQCCHMGADLGRCGWVSGDRLACGYHAWEFETDGRCAAIPRVPAASIPRRARQHAVPVIERAGNIYFWYGPEPVREFLDVSHFDSSQFLNVKGEVYIGRGEPLPISEHIVDSYHFPYSHRITAPVEYAVLANEGDRFEFQLRPAGGQPQSKVQRLFNSHAFGEMAAPCIGVYRTQQDATIDRTSPMLTVLTGGTPVREGLFIFTWRIAVRKIGPDRYFGPLNRVLGRLMFFIIKWNYYSDMEVLRWMRAPAKPLSVKPDGAAIREYRAFYRRHILPGWRFGDPTPAGEPTPTGEPTPAPRNDHDGQPTAADSHGGR